MVFLFLLRRNRLFSFFRIKKFDQVRYSAREYVNHMTELNEEVVLNPTCGFEYTISLNLFTVMYLKEAVWSNL